MSDIPQYPVNNEFIMYCSCVHTIAISFVQLGGGVGGGGRNNPLKLNSRSSRIIIYARDQTLISAEYIHSHIDTKWVWFSAHTASLPLRKPPYYLTLCMCVCKCHVFTYTISRMRASLTTCSSWTLSWASDCLLLSSSPLHSRSTVLCNSRCSLLRSNCARCSWFLLMTP